MKRCFMGSDYFFNHSELKDFYVNDINRFGSKKNQKQMT